MNLAILLVILAAAPTPDAGVRSPDAGRRPLPPPPIAKINPHIPDGGYANLTTPDQAFQVDYRAPEPSTLTVAVWLKASTKNYYRILIGKLWSMEYKGPESNYAWALTQDGAGNWGMTVKLTDGAIFTCSADAGHKLVFDEEWYMLSATFNAQKIFLYKDGQPAGTCNGPSIEVGFGIQYGQHGPLLLPRDPAFFDGHVSAFTHKDAAWHLRLFNAQRNAD